MQCYDDKLTSDTLKRLKRGGELSANDMQLFWLKSLAKSSQTNSALEKLSRERNANEAANCQQTDATRQGTSVHVIAPMLAKSYHNLIHSDLLMAKLFQLEHFFSKKYAKLLADRRAALFATAASAENSSSSGGVDYQLSEENKWRMRLDTLRDSQQRTFRRFISFLAEYKEKHPDYVNEEASKLDAAIESFYDDNHLNFDSDYFATASSSTSNGLNGRLSGDEWVKVGSSSSVSAAAAAAASRSMSYFQSHTHIEESYTIQLGAQLKATHNLRLIRCDILDFCKNKFKESDESRHDASSALQIIEPQAIQTAMSLYSDKLCALVVLEDARDLCPSSSDNRHPKRNPGGGDDDENEASISARLADVFDKNGCDLHFMPNEQQLRVANDLLRSMGKSVSVGDFFLTRHSTLSQAHVLFHLITSSDSTPSSATTTESLKSPSSSESLINQEMSSRHPIIAGLRNIFKICLSKNIQTLTFPLLLVHEMTEVSRVCELFS